MAFRLFGDNYSMGIAEIDLHGMETKWAMKVLSSWIKGQRTPFRIITGNGSGAMSRATKEILISKGFIFQYESDWNLGTLIISGRKDETKSKKARRTDKTSK